MKITICDICQQMPDQKLLPVVMYRFEEGEDWLGKPKQVKEICDRCLHKIFKPHQQQ